MLACLHRHADVVALLLHFGAKTNVHSFPYHISRGVPDVAGRRIMCLGDPPNAFDADHADAKRMRLAAASATAALSSSPSPSQTLQRHPLVFEPTLSFPNQGISTSILQPHFTIKSQSSSGLPITCCQSTTALHIAAASAAADPESSILIMKMLLVAGARFADCYIFSLADAGVPGADANARDGLGRSAFASVCACGNVDVAAFALGFGAGSGASFQIVVLCSTAAATFFITFV